LERLGLGFERLREVNPKVCLVSISGYGHTGPFARTAGHDINYLALSGWLHELIPEHGEPVLPDVQMGDVLGGAVTAAFAAVSAILDARATGTGSHVDVSMTAALLSNNVLPMAYAQARKPSPRPGRGLLNGGVPCYGLYRTRDGRYLAVGALESKFWVSLCEVLGRPELAERHWQNGQEVGGEDARQVRAELARAFAAEPLSYWQKLFADVDCCVTPVLRTDEVLQHPVSKDYVTRVAVAGGSALTTVRSGLRVKQ
jgi:crotonobetainyl-CoA:carnitine CoA-transferase CaiB-like acyl-CoA transferase